MTRVYLSLGSNIDRERHLRRGCALLRQRFGALTLSPTYESPAAGFDGEPFYNLAAAFDTDAPVGEIAAALRDIEAVCGRDRAQPKFSSRTLDIDLLLYGDLVSAGPPVLPRADILEYDFVLRPLVDLAPDLVHPVSGRRLAAHLAAHLAALTGGSLRRVDLAL